MITRHGRENHILVLICGRAVSLCLIIAGNEHETAAISTSNGAGAEAESFD